MPEMMIHEVPQRAAVGQRKLTLSLTLTLTLSILGSSVLAVPYAFSKTGVLLGLLTMLVVAYANSVGSQLLLRAAQKTGHDTFEGVAQAAGGPALKVLTRASLVLLLFGTIVGVLAQLTSIGLRAVYLLYSNQPPAWLVASDGRVVMLVLTLGIVTPLCCLRRMRSLELVGTGGFVITLFFVGLVFTTSIMDGVPAIRSGELPVLGLRDKSALPESFAVFGFACYIAPVVMPLYAELPSGQAGVQALSSALWITVMLVTVAVDCIVGVFAAGRYGVATRGNVLENQWLGGKADGALNALMAAFLAISLPPMQMSLRYTIDEWIMGEDAPESARRSLLETAGIMLTCLPVALLFPSASEKVFAITGASAVCLVCYVCPVAIHLLLLRAPGQPEAGEDQQVLLEQQGALQAAGISRQLAWGCRTWLSEVVVPCGVLVLGVGFSLAALWVALPLGLFG